jgi:S1-C subfamily serine protease
VLKIGHPVGFIAGRTPPVRLGKTVAVADPLFVSDCPTVGGDSGGPFFDLDGRLVGIVRNSRVPRSIFGTSGVARARGVIPFSVTPVATLRAKLGDLREGKVIGDLLADTEEARRFDAALQTAEALPAGRWAQGPETLAAFADVIKPARAGVVAVVDGENQVVLGTVVEDGFVLTKASPLPNKPACRLPDGKVVAAELTGVDPAFDLALLRVKADGLKPVQWAAADAPVGSLLVAPGLGEAPLCVGVVSVARRDMKTTPPKVLARPAQAPATPPAFLGSRVQGRGYWVEFASGSAAAAGIRAGDVIVTINGVPIREHSDLAAAVAGRHGGERVPVALVREGKIDHSSRGIHHAH